MPHVIYLHSGLTQNRIQPHDEKEKRRIFGFEKIDVVIAMAIAGLVNMAMLFMAAKVFHFTGHADVADINTAYQTLGPLLGGGAALIFGISLFASGSQLARWDDGRAGCNAGVCGLSDPCRGSRDPDMIPPCLQSPLDSTRPGLLS